MRVEALGPDRGAEPGIAAVGGIHGDEPCGVEGRSVNLPGFVNVEAGRQGTDAAAENAYDCLLAYLRITDALPGDPGATPTTLYHVSDVIEKEPGREYRFEGENFARVPAGGVYARSVDGEHVLRAGSDLWPVLMSADGHERLLGYTATAAEPLAESVPAPAGETSGFTDRSGG
jgi:hypothetical protein